jgi:hypothetical protein
MYGGIADFGNEKTNLMLSNIVLKNLLKARIRVAKYRLDLCI